MNFSASLPLCDFALNHTMNLPNKLTISRFILTVAFMAVIISEVPFHQTVALALFAVASLTDYFDGMIARRDKFMPIGVRLGCRKRPAINLPIGRER